MHEESVSQFMNSNGDVVSYLNITSARPEDGGRYTCRAHNSRGAVEHSTRSIGPVRAVAGVNTTIFCPYSGFPISEIRWQRGGMDLSSTGSRALSGIGGDLLLWPAESNDAGVYLCRVTAPSGQYAQKDIQIFVKNPPKIAGFNFPTDLVEGSSIQVLCGITSGDKPVQAKSLDEFSFLIFSHVTSKHSGDYTCVATNNAAAVNHTARLAVKVAPTWVYEPQDVSALLGTQIMVNCVTKGYPEPRIAWLKGHGTGVADFRPVTNLDLQFSVLGNGSLSIAPATHHHEGQYMCRADNGIGRGLSKIIAVSVNEPAHFEYSSRNMTVKRTGPVTLQCDARGDPPIQLQWTHNMKRVELTTYRVSVSEKRSDSGVSSTLSIAHAARHDSGVYRCRADNAYGRDELLIYLAVQARRSASHTQHGMTRACTGVARITPMDRGGRAVTLAWTHGFDGNAAVRAYRLQFRAIGDTRTRLTPDWADAPTRDLSEGSVGIHERKDPSGTGTEEFFEYRLDGLRPATAYALRLAAINAIGDSDYSDPVIIQTLEEAPAEPPHNVQVTATAPGELLVKWQPPSQETWNGELLGYVVSWREGSPLTTDNSSHALTAPGWGASHASLVALRTHTHYEVRVSAFNAVGAGPASAPLTTTTLEGAPEAPPERVRCEPLSAQSVRVWWETPPPAQRGGVLLGYEILYEVVDELESQAETRRSGGMETVLQSLRRAVNYSISVRARTAAGVGPPSEPVYCTTHEDRPPADIKAFANSEDSVIVSWLAPVQKNGKIKHYTVYNRPQRTGQHSQLSIPHIDGEEEFHVEVRGLQQQVYEFWVTAATASGEGEMSAVVSKKPDARASAKITSFSRRIQAAVGKRVRLACGAAGSPPPHRSWTRKRPAPPLFGDHRFLMEGPFLIILSIDRSTADNYSCVVRNPWGEDHGSWELVAAAPPLAPRVSLSAAAHARLALSWDAPLQLPHAPVLQGFVLEYSRIDEPTWYSLRLAADSRSYSLERLACGMTHRVRLIAYNAIGYSSPGEELIASTKGGRNTCVRLNLLTWDSNGCPLSQFIVSIKKFEESNWRSQPVSPGAQPFLVCGLPVATWHHLKVLATNTAGKQIPRPKLFPPANGEVGEGENTAVYIATCGCIAIGCFIFLALMVWKRCSEPPCIRKGYQQAVISADEDNKSSPEVILRRYLAELDFYEFAPNHTESFVIKVVSLQPYSEMYEISPYATFSMSGGATGPSQEECTHPGGCNGSECSGGNSGGCPGGVSEAAGGGTLRTFGRAEPVPLQAVPPRHHHHRDNNS
ncbi:Down syndrome cell adhesion molecule-like protein, partial [Operophtera brumata]